MFKGSKKRYGYKTPGYGTKWGTSFGSGLGKYEGKKARNGISKKVLGLGVGAGFLGGAAAGVAGTMATYSVYHKYQEFRRRIHLNQMRLAGIGMDETGAPDVDWDDDYYQVLIIFSLCRYIYYTFPLDSIQNYYLSNSCIGGCDTYSHCEWGVCECNAGTTRR